MSDRIWLSAPHMSGREIELVGEAFASNWLSTVGPQLDAFEAELGELAGAHCCALASGTAAIHLGLRLLGVGPGDEVLAPSLTFVASVNPIVYLGAKPVFVDSEPRTWNIDPNLVEDALRARRDRPPKAIVVVHLYGQSAELDALLELGERYGVPVLEDAAEALGTTYRGRQVGALGDAGVFSFNGNKMITATSGGALVSRDEALVREARNLAQQARDPGIAYEHSRLGYNYRLSNVLAAIGRGQLGVLPERVAARRAIAERYEAGFADIPGLERMPQATHGRHTNWLSVFLTDEEKLGCSRDALIEALAAEAIEARPVWKPMHLQPLYAEAPCVGGSLAEDLFRRGICLPSSSFLTDADVDRVIDGVRRRIGRATG